ncbi:MAG TPA: LysR family transcriptional regulator [Xanthobacteraceae bacterium]|nr:LysR family transcriptional regulator [Xanthobacteraceae bacterium]
MELRHLRYFVAVADERNFTRAAQRLGITQPSLSSQIKQLETELGTPLFRRETRSVELTDAGKLMLEEARIVLAEVERARTGVARHARGETGKINLGSAGATYFHPLIPAIIREFRKEHPEVILTPEESNTSMLLARLRAGAIDLAFVRPPFSDTDGLKFEPLVKEPILMVLPAAHPLAHAKSAPLSALAQERIILFERTINPPVYDAILAAFARAGFSPRLAQEAPQVPSAIPMVAAGLGVTLVPASMSCLRPDGVVFVPVEGPALPAEICLAYRRTQRSAAVKNFVSVARRQAQAAAHPVISSHPKRSKPPPLRQSSAPDQKDARRG